MNIKCQKCDSMNCHEYRDVFICFDCKNKVILTKVNYKINRIRNVGDGFQNKLSGNKGGNKRYFVGLK